MKSRQASCSCGNLLVTARDEPVRISVCHCLACQRRTGSAFGAQAWFANDNISVSGSSQVYHRTGDSGSEITYHFCPNCGATVYYHLDALTDVTAVPLGAFADPEFPAPTVSVYEARQHDWFSLKQFDEHYD